jgi:hypothetical protein
MNLFLFPIEPGTKKPALNWTKITRPTEDQVQEWLDKGYSLALATGEQSGNIEVIDVDDAEFLRPWQEAVAEAGHVSLFDLMPRVRTSKGWHFYYHCEEIQNSKVLARIEGKREDGGDTAIETRGNGGYVLIPNKNDDRYEHEHKDIVDAPTITPEQREVLWECARLLCKKPKVQKDFAKHPNKPGDDYNEKMTWPEILEPRGWTMIRERPEGVTEWCRPGKTYGISATVGMYDADFLYVFSSNAGVEPGKGYSKFGYYVAADHDGDYAAGAKQLAKEGYGEAPKRKRTSALKILIGIGRELDRFVSPDGTAYTYLEGFGSVPVKSEIMKSYLDTRYEAAKGGYSPEKDLSDAVSKLDRNTLTNSEVRPLHNRIGYSPEENAIYVDLGQRKSTRAVRITAEGWTIVDKPSVLFRRAGSIAPLPDPERGGTVDDLLPFLNAQNEADAKMLIAWLVSCFNPDGTFPILVIQGGEGAAKSYGTSVLRRIIDPMVPPLLPYPKSSEALIHSAYHNYVLAFDNLSGVSNEISDTLCVLASGSGYATRKLYTNLDQVTFEAKRPIIVNGIDNIAHRNDLASRTLTLTFEHIDDKDKLDEKILYREINRVLPGVLGHIYDAVAMCLADPREESLGVQSRLVDFTKWTVAAAPALKWDRSDVIDMIEENTKAVLGSMAENDLVAQYTIKFMEEIPEWEGTASELFEQIDEVVPNRVSRSRSWPNSPTALGMRLQRAKPILKAAGIAVGRQRKKVGTIYTLVADQEVAA